MKEIITPGTLLSEQPMRVEFTYVEKGKTYSGVLGLYDSERGSIVPLEGIWGPRIGDTVVGIVSAVKNTVYEVDIKFFGRTLLIGSKFDRHTYKIGDVIQAMVKDIENRKTIILENPRELFGGTLIEVRPTKIPRIIGKANTMIEQIMQMTKTNIVVGNNGIVWLKGGNVALATATIRRIEDEAHTSGLTERIKQMLQEQMVK